MNTDHHHGSYTSYTIGFVSSLILTFIPYLVVTRHLAGEATIPIVVILAVLQLVVQLVFFLHLSAHPKERWNLAALIFTILMLWFIVIGSLWIMNHLNRNMTQQQIDTYMHKQN